MDGKDSITVSGQNSTLPTQSKNKKGKHGLKPVPQTLVQDKGGLIQDNERPLIDRGLNTQESVNNEALIPHASIAGLIFDTKLSNEEIEQQLKEAQEKKAEFIAKKKKLKKDTERQLREINLKIKMSKLAESYMREALQVKQHGAYKTAIITMSVVLLVSVSAVLVCFKMNPAFAKMIFSH